MNKNQWRWWLAALIGLAFLLRFGQLTAYFLAAVAVSFVGKPIVAWIASRRVGKRSLGSTVGAAITLVLMISLASGVVLLFAPLIQDQIAALGTVSTEELLSRWNEALVKVDAWTVGLNVSGDGQANSAYLASQAAELVKLDNASHLFGDLLSSIGNLFIAAFSTLFMAFFLMREPALFQHLVLSLSPEQRRASMTKIMERSGQLLTRYFGGLIIQVSIVTLIVGLGLTLLSIPHGWLLGLLAGLCNLIPYLGPILGLAVGTLVMISSGVDWIHMAWGWSVYLAAQAVDNVFTQPVIFAQRVFAHPLEIFVVISVAGSLAGAAGMVLAIPGYTLIRIVAREFLQETPWVQALTRRIEDEGNVEES